MTPRCQLGEDQSSVDSYFEGTSIGGNHRDGLDARFKRFEQFSRQTDGTRSVMSDRAVFDGNDHHSAPEMGWNYYIVNQRGKDLEACFWYNHISE